MKNLHCALSALALASLAGAAFAVAGDDTARLQTLLDTGRREVVFPGVQDVGTVTLRNIRRVEDASFVNVRRTIEVGDYVEIRRLNLENVTEELAWPRSTMDVAMSADVENICHGC